MFYLYLVVHIQAAFYNHFAFCQKVQTLILFTLWSQILTFINIILESWIVLRSTHWPDSWQIVSLALACWEHNVKILATSQWGIRWRVKGKFWPEDMLRGTEAKFRTGVDKSLARKYSKWRKVIGRNENNQRPVWSYQENQTQEAMTSCSI